MNSDYIKNLEASQMKTDVAEFAVHKNFRNQREAPVIFPRIFFRVRVLMRKTLYLVPVFLKLSSETSYVV